MGLNNAINSAKSLVVVNEEDKSESKVEISLGELNRILEALPTLAKAKHHKLKILTEEYRQQRKSLGAEINEINILIAKIREQL